MSGMAKTPALSRADRALIEDMYGRGCTQGQIAIRLQRSSGSIGYQLLELGLTRSDPTTRRQDYMREGRLVMCFTAAEDAAIERLSCEGLGHAGIGKELGRLFPGRARRHHVVRARLQQLAIAAEAGAEE